MTSPHPKIPDHAQRVFKGVIFDIYQWEQELYDGTTTTFELAVRPDTVVVIPLDGETVYYSEQEQPGKTPFIGLFGGRADPGETPLEVAKRELMEEAGMTAETLTPYFTFSVPGRIAWDIHYIIARGCKITAPQALDGGEKITIQQTTLNCFIPDVVMHKAFSERELKQRITRGNICDDAAAQMIATLKGQQS